jgi:hypothetical protein
MNLKLLTFLALVVIGVKSHGKPSLSKTKNLNNFSIDYSMVLILSCMVIITPFQPGLIFLSLALEQNAIV